MSGGWLRPLPLLAAALAAVAVLFVNESVSATLPFTPTFDAFLSNPATSAHSNLRFVTSVPSGSQALGSWSAVLPNGWGVGGDNQVADGDVVATGTMSVDVDCNGSIEHFGPFNLLDDPTFPGQDSPIAEWAGQITSWWNFLITVDDTQPFPGDPVTTDLSAPLNNVSELHTFCAPQTFILTVFGLSSPNDDIVLTNPNSAGAYGWEGSFGSMGGAYIVNVTDSVCVGNACDYDSDAVPDVTDNCDTWPNAVQALPPWPVPPDDPDCDGFSSAVENPVGTNALVHCGYNAWPADVNNDAFSDISDVSALTASFGMSVPPAPVRHNIAPDPVDGFVDITDVSRITAFFGLTCSACAGDLDCDTVLDVSDNCPSWPNPAQNLPPWPVPANDPDCDSSSSGVEISVTTNPLAHCGLEAWPADVNNDTFSDISDVSALTANFGIAVPPAPARHNIAPDPVDTFVDITDISKMTAFFGLGCS